ncbi:LOW QUALITY PROTEIN: ER membrane protein complex subunit 10 [Ixodes scapularis]|uniref:LOW QUALITY PROTEIN: ER membrane protein complex subunit 10 n=1 Tax=Ixodes scapularis TaxID=6945 RepID=UPI001A9E638A|nr:LOW QUALITY PROTEIN: ER membrane protein complex subunit 10 [Ixodes scapularis]
MTSLLILPAILAVLSRSIHANDLEDKQLTFSIHHSLDDGPDPVYLPRGTVTIPLARTEDSVLHQVPLSTADVAKLRRLAENNGLYRIQVVDHQSEDPRATVSSFMKACSVYESGLTDSLTLTLDRNGALLGTTVFSGQQCEGSHVPDYRLASFNTTLTVSLVNLAPAPDTQTYIRRLEQEKADKARGDSGDNRSFFAKYWMYIMPLLIFLLISGVSNPEGQGSGVPDDEATCGCAAPSCNICT